jgi:hypothetical protein
MRIVLLLTMTIIALLAIDAAEFHGHYRKVVWIEMDHQERTLQHKAQRAVEFF